MRNYFLILVLITIFLSSCKKDTGISITGTVADIEGNIYKTIKIGDQWWMAENLKVTQYRNGDAIPMVTDNAAWTGLTSGAYCNHSNNESNAFVYGRLYNWYALTDSRNLCPEGWHIPTYEEWGELIEFLGGADIAGGKMKTTDTTLWAHPNAGATNVSGFTGIPGASRSFLSGVFYSLGKYGSWGSSTESNVSGCFYTVNLDHNNTEAYFTSGSKKEGVSVRCVKDK